MQADTATTHPRWRPSGFGFALGFTMLLVVIGLGELLVFGLAAWLDRATLEGMFPGAEAHRMHGIGHGIVAWTIALCAVVQLWRGHERLAPAVLGLIAVSIYTLAALLSGTFSGLEVVGIAAFAALVWLHPARIGATLRPIRPITPAVSVPLVAGGLILGATELQRQLAGSAADEHVVFGHYGIMATLAATGAAAALIASTSLPGARTTGWLAVLGALAFGVASILFPGSTSSLGVGPGVILLAAATALGAALLISRPTLAAHPDPALDAIAHRQRAT
jgi:hypothetical protein